MIISRQWLQDFIVEPLPDTPTLVDGLIMHVFEVESVEKKGDDEVFDIKVLPDRAHYALSHRGVATEVCAIFGLTFKDVIPKINIPTQNNLEVKIEDSKLCRRYSAVQISGVTVGESPLWLKGRLEAIGQKTINNIVDATNYTMFSLGQPLHAFDAEKVSGSLVARAGKVGEKLELLNATGVTSMSDRSIDLGKGECVIADDSGPLVLAGIKGGLKTSVSGTTKNIILEAANFDPVSIRKFSTIYNLRSDTSKRFENEITPEFTVKALSLCADIILKIAGGEVIDFQDVYPQPFPEHTVSVSSGDVLKLLGISLKDSDIEDILKKLSFDFKKEADIFVVSVPPERLDLRITEDMVEEIGRLYGYHHIDSRRPTTDVVSQAPNWFVLEDRVRGFLIARGFDEVITYVFRPHGEIELANAFASDKSHVRDTIVEAMREALVSNVRYADLLGLSKIRIFEIGNIFKKDGEKKVCTIGVAFAKKIKGETVDGEIESVVEALCAHVGVNRDSIPAQSRNGIIEIDLDALAQKFNVVEVMDDIEVQPVVHYSPVSPYPFVVRDVAVWTPTENVAREIEVIIREESGVLLKRLEQFDVFTKDGKTSYAYRLVLQSMEKTLEENEIVSLMGKITDRLNAHEGWSVR